MKKLIILTAVALAFASCASDDLVGGKGNPAEDGQTAIGFNSLNPNMTRANRTPAESAADLDNNFVVVGFKGSAKTAANTEYVFDHYNVNYVGGTANTTLSNTANWEYVGQDMKVKGTNPAASLAQNGATVQTIKYWDHAAASHDFIAFSMGKGVTENGTTTYATPTAVDVANLSTAAYTLTGDAQTLAECYISDMTTVEEANYNTQPVMMTFRHLTSKVRMALYEAIPGYVVKDVKFRTVLTDSHAPADDANTTAALIGTDAFNASGKLTVYFPTTGTDNKGNSDYNKAHVDFTADATSGTKSNMTFSTVNYANAAEDAIAAGSTYLGQTAATASYCGTGTEGKDYVTVLPHENDSKVLSIQIDYTLVPTDGANGGAIKVYGARADIPAAYTAWKSGYAYTYIFKLSQNTNGHTGTSTDDKGLTAISFDAIVLNDETNGLQETITTVATPSITTYGYIAASNTVSTNANEYATGTDIYATVQDGTDAKAATNIYTVTQTNTDNKYSAPAQAITETAIANCIARGGSVKDANGWTLAVAAVQSTEVAAVPTSANTTLTVPALKWTAGVSGTIYAVEYVKIVTPAVLYADESEYNTAKGTTLDADGFAALTDAEKTKTPAVTTKAYKLVRIQ